MRFHTDDSQSDRGFHIAVKQNDCDNIFSTTSADDLTDCDATFSKPEGQLVSVNYPHNYGNNLDCRLDAYQTFDSSVLTNMKLPLLLRNIKPLC